MTTPSLNLLRRVARPVLGLSRGVASRGLSWLRGGERYARKPDAPRLEPGRPHTAVRPLADYCPWNLSADFRATYELVRGHTLVDLYRCYSLWELVAEVATLPGPGSLLEVGVWRGGTGGLIARRAAACGLADTVYLCDTFAGVVKAGPMDTYYKGGEHADTSQAVVADLLAGLGLTNTRVVTGVFPDESAAAIPNGPVRFCHIDVDVYRSAADILTWVWPRLRSGGLVVYDDYGFGGCEGVTRHVDEQRGRPDRLVMHNLNGQAVLVKR